MLGNASTLYAGKTVLFCWEHKNIPFIFNQFGLTTALQLDDVFWGKDPTSPVRHSWQCHTPCRCSMHAANSCRSVPEAVLA